MPTPNSRLLLLLVLVMRIAPRRSSVANAGGRAFCQELGMGWVHIGQWIFSISAISHWLFWRNCVFCAPANPVKFFWSKMAFTCGPHIVLHVSCRTRTSGGYLRPSEVRFRGYLGPKYTFRAIDFIM